MGTRRARLIFAILATASLGLAPLALAQRVVSAKSGFVYFILGRAWVDNAQLRSGETGRQLNNGETLYTERGRAEVLLNPGTVLRLGDMSRVRMDDVTLTDPCVTFLSGAAVVTVKYLPKPDKVTLHLGSDGVVTLTQPGVYRLDSGRLNVDEVRLRVYEGSAQVQRGSGAVPISVGGGKSIALDSSLVAKFNPNDKDSLERWSDTRSRSMPVPRELRELRPVPPSIFEASSPRPH